MDIGSLVGLLNPLNWLEKVYKHIQRPKLQIYFDPHETFHTRALADFNGIPGFFCHLMVKNNGKEVAKNCYGQLIEIQVKNQDGKFILHPDFVNPVILKWAHEPDFYPIDIDPDIPRRLDLCFSVSSQPFQFSFFSHKIPSGNRTDFPPGIYRVKVRIKSDNAKSIDGSFQIVYKGIWNEFEISEENYQ